MVEKERDELRQELVMAYKELRATSPDKKPTQNEFCEAAGIPRSRLKMAYGTRAYAKLQKECGDIPNVWSQERVSLDEIMRQYGNLVRRMESEGPLPTSTEWQYENCKPVISRLFKRFKWAEVPVQFLKWAVDKDEWREVVAVVSAKVDVSQVDKDEGLDKSFESVIQLVEQWAPNRKRRSEEAYQVALRGFLEEKKCKVEEGTGDSDVDLAVNRKVGIELKKDPVLAEYDRCFGQIARHLNYYDYVMVVVLDVSNQDRFRHFENNLDRYYVAHGMNVSVLRK